jgi:hypothetical protein
MSIQHREMEYHKMKNKYQHELAGVQEQVNHMEVIPQARPVSSENIITKNEDADALAKTHEREIAALDVKVKQIKNDFNALEARRTESWRALNAARTPMVDCSKKRSLEIVGTTRCRSDEVM